MAPFRIENLPGELRNEIYTKVSLYDKIALMRTSRSTNQDVSPLFYKEATLPILVNVCHPFMRITYLTITPPPPEINKNIQNLDVYWEPIVPEEVKEGDIAALSWVPPIRRELCRVFYKWIPAGQGLLKPFMDSGLRTFAGFETVEIRVELEPQGQPPIDEEPARESGYKPKASNTPCPKVMPMYRQLKKELKSALGVAELIQKPPDHYLKFQPRKRRADATKKS